MRTRATRALLDSNLLLLLIVGLTGPNLIPSHKRLKEFLEADFDLLSNMLRDYDKVILTANTATETSNLSRFIAEPARTRIARTFAAVCSTQFPELSVPSHSACKDAAFLRLGLTDCVLLACSTNDCELITVDTGLHIEATRRGLRSLNFNHLRDHLL